jgi:GT2 family glycosyltransferase
MPLSISALIPAFNRERFVGEAIESVRNQERRVDEIIVVDDGSTDGTARVAASFADVQLIRLPQTRGTSGARNAAIAAARGDVLAWLDSDDIWLPDHTATGVDLLERHPTAVVSFTGSQCFGQRHDFWPMPDVPEATPFDAVLSSFKRVLCTMSPAFTRREVVASVQGFDESLPCAVDFDLFLRLSLKGPFVCSHQVSAKYRWHGDQISSRLPRQLEAAYTSRMNLLRSLRDAGQGEQALVLRQWLPECLHRDLWSSWARRDPLSIETLVKLANVLHDASLLPKPFGRESVRDLRRYSMRRAETLGSPLTAASVAQLFGRPRWLYKRALDAEMKYRWSRLTAPPEVWLCNLIEAGKAWGDLRRAS